MERACKDCAYYFDRFQHCRRHTPVVTSSQGGSPYTVPDSWCGEFVELAVFETMQKAARAVVMDSGVLEAAAELTKEA